MDMIPSGQLAQTMSSREIAELTLSTHDSVLKSIRRYVEQGVVSGNETPYTHPQNGQTYTEFLLGFRDAMVIASGYSPNLRARIIDRWMALEQKQIAPAFQIPTTLSGALRLAAEQAEVIEQQAAQLEAAKPAIAFVDRYVDSTGSKGFRQVCKLLKAKEPEFRQFLHESKIMYKLGGEWVPYAYHIDCGYFEVRTGTAEVSGHAFNSARFTPKGIAWVAAAWAKYQIKDAV